MDIPVAFPDCRAELNVVSSRRVMQASLHPRLDALRRALPPRSPGGAHAAVALALRPRESQLEVLLILRAERSGDPWSGHVALPGGRRDADDAHDLATAVRETQEEVGIDLGAGGLLLGGLDPVAPRSNAGGMLVAPWVFAVPEGTLATPNPEVQAATWVTLAALAEPASAAEYRYQLPNGSYMVFPAIRVHGLTIWGMTYRVLLELLAYRVT
jgi:8-oxo-dGTP pyrophosphatase MutT (NUDIX family)